MESVSVRDISFAMPASMRLAVAAVACLAAVAQGSSRQPPPEAGDRGSSRQYVEERNAAYHLSTDQLPMFVSSNSNNNNNHLYKKSEQPQWDDLGWAWGRKRSAASAGAAFRREWHWPSGMAAAPSQADDDFSPHNDLRLIDRPAARSVGKLPASPPNVAEDQHLSGGGGGTQRWRALQSLVKKTPDWNDLGWAWGRRR